MPEPGWIAPELASELPGLAIFTDTVAAAPRRSPTALKERLRELGDRFRGARAINLRQQPIPWAYRVFFRHIGLDPDTTRTPVEQLALERMHDGRFKSRGRPADALTLATAETGVALLAFDADSPRGGLGLRLSEQGERFEGRVSAPSPSRGPPWPRSSGRLTRPDRADQAGGRYSVVRRLNSRVAVIEHTTRIRTDQGTGPRLPRPSSRNCGDSAPRGAPPVQRKIAPDRISSMPIASIALGRSPNCSQANSTPSTGVASVPSPVMPADMRRSA